MREYSSAITLTHNARGIYSIDPSVGCASGVNDDPKGCYSDCYAARYAKRYGYDFSKTVLRKFKDQKHIDSIVRKINRIEQPFIRMGTSGDPSENWEHTIDIIKKLDGISKEIVIITKHWNALTDSQLKEISKRKVCINTSVSVLDGDMLDVGLREHERLKPFCRSILRVVSCDFNKESSEGARLSKLQDQLFNDYNVLDTVLRVSKSNSLVTSELINIKETKFLGKKCYVSKRNRKAYMGKCDTCIEKCGVNMKP
jgi:hypothetical protein